MRLSDDKKVTALFHETTGGLEQETLVRSKWRRLMSVQGYWGAQ